MSMSISVLPSLMCTGCKNYSFDKYDGNPHRCDSDEGWTNSSKLGQDPRIDGTASSCNLFIPR